MPTVRLVRAVHFSAGHSYVMPSASVEENRKVFGPLFHEGGGFGHNFKLEAHFEGEIDPLTGMIENLAVIDTWLKDVVALVDHRYLNRDVEFFRTHPATAENIAVFCSQELKKRMVQTAVRLAKVRLFEGDSTWIDL